MKIVKNSLRDLSHEISYHPDKRLELFRGQSTAEKIEVFFLLSPHVQQTLIEALTIKELITFINQLDFDQAGRILARIRNERKRKQVARKLKTELKEKAEYFLRFSPKAEFTLLNFNYIFLPDTTSIIDASYALDQHYKETGKIPEILVQKNGKCIGEVVMGTLVRERNTGKLGKYITQIFTISYKANPSEIKKVFTKSEKRKVVVIDTDHSVLGIIYTDDVKRLFNNGSAGALYDFAGVSDSERVFDPVMSKVNHRYKWLLINLFTGFLAASVVGLFENTLQEFVLLAIYMPIVAGMGGNAATQTLAVTVRGIAVGEVSLANVKQAIKKEVSAGILNGFIVGVVVAFAASLINQSPLLGLIIAISMMVNLVVAGFFGALVPVVMKSFGKDPATSATIFITTATDVFGFFTFLGLATLFLV